MKHLYSESENYNMKLSKKTINSILDYFYKEKKIKNNDTRGIKPNKGNSKSSSNCK